MSKQYRVYILASDRNGTLYIGVTGDMCRRIQEHKDGIIDGFTKKYNVKTLVYCEQTTSIEAAIKREKQLKSRKRKWKLELIEEHNPHREDLSHNI